MATRVPVTHPATYDDARLILKLYELRRDEKLREAREWYRTRFFPRSFEEVKGVLNAPTQENTWLRMVTGYWEMAASFVTHGVLEPELFFASAGEALVVWAKLEEHILPIRREVGMPNYLENLQKAIGGVAWASERVRLLRERMDTFRERYQTTGRAGA